MLSMLGWQTAPIPFGRKAQAETQKQSTMSYASKTKPAQSQTRAAPSGPTYYVFSSSGSYLLESQRPPPGYAGQSSAGHSQPPAAQHGPASSTTTRPDFKASTSSQKVVSSADRSNSKNTSPSRSFNIYPDTPMLDSFVYERSEADSDTLTCYSNSSVDTLIQFPTAAPSSQPPTARRNSVMLVTGPSEVAAVSTTQSAPDSPHPLPISLPSSSSSLAIASQGRPLPRSGEDGSRPRSGSDESGSSRRRVSVSDPQRPAISPPGPSNRSSSPPRTSPGGRFPERTSGPSDFPSGARDAQPARRNSDPTMELDVTRKRRLSGAVIPTGFGVLPGERRSPTNHRDSITVVPAGIGSTDRHSPPLLHGAPSPDGHRERFSPEREVSTSPGFALERRTNGAGANGFPAPPPGSFYDRDRPPMRRGSQSSGSTARDEVPPRVAGFAPGPVPIIRSRTISKGRIGDAPKPIFVAGLETSKMVRFSEKLICPSPIPLEKRRRGWYNKRGDQLWTNDGVFVAPDPGTEYPLELSEYPEVGSGWQNEEGIRIDMQHRLIPKPPLRPALKRGGSSAASQPQLQLSVPARPENRGTFASTVIREET